MFWISAVQAQDPQYSQYYAAPIFHNPAFTGTGAPQRLNFNNRIQWPGLPAPYINYTAAFDYHIRQAKMGVGLIATQDVAGISKFRTTSFGAAVAKQIEVNKEISFSLGMVFSYDIRDIGTSTLIFPDQVTPDGILAATQEPRREGRVAYVNYGLGGLLYGHDWWVGLSIHNMGQPSLEPLGGRNSILYSRTTIISGLRFPLQDERYLKKGEVADAIMPSIMYRSQGSVSQIDFGVNAELQGLILGLYCRGLPFINNVRGVFTQDAVIATVGARINEVRIGYSYDYNTSQSLSSFQGAHEISVQIGLDIRKYRKLLVGPCPGMW